MDVNLAFIDYIPSSSALPTIGLVTPYQFAFRDSMLFMLRVTILLAFVQSVLIVL